MNTSELKDKLQIFENACKVKSKYFSKDLRLMCDYHFRSKKDYKIKYKFQRNYKGKFKALYDSIVSNINFNEDMRIYYLNKKRSKKDIL